MKLLITLTVGLILFSCDKPLFKDDELSLPRESYSGSQLKLSGYYYHSYQTSDNQTYHENYFFYRNGIVLYGDSYNIAKVQNKEISYMNGSFYNNVKDTKYYWGIFVIDGDNLRFEKWYPSSGGPLPAYIEEGKIINDTTFNITETYRLKNGKKKDVEEVDFIYHFKPLTPKPDSTNEFTN